MLAYAADAPRFPDRRKSPRALVLIVGAHVAALAAVMTARMDMPIIGRDPPIKVIDIIEPPAPPEVPPPPRDRSTPTPQQTQSQIDKVSPIVPINPIGPIVVDPLPQPPIGPIAGGGTVVVSRVPVPPVRVAARFATPGWALKPPYPSSKLASEEEASLRLRLSIDDKGRVVAVEPVGAADPAFLAAARKHLIARWRYKPATEDGRPVHSSTVITLRFELEA